MTDRMDRTDLDGFDRQVDAFVVRLDGLRSTPPAERETAAGALAAALVELEAAERELRVAREELHAQRARVADPAADRERKLLRAVLGDLPVPVFLLERDGIVRRANRAACELVDVPAAYPVGKPFSVFVSLRDRGALRYAVSTAAAGVTGTPVRGALLARGRDREAVLWLAPLQPPGEAETLVALVALPAGAGAPAAAARLAAAKGHPASARTPGDGRTAGPDGARRLDTMAAMTRLLLEHGGAGESELLRRAAELLRDRLADWVLVDLVDGTVDGTADGTADGDGGLTRRLVVGADPAVAERVRAAGPIGRRTLPGRVASTRRPELVVRLEDPAEIGPPPGTGAAGTALGATSVIAAPLLPGGAENALGTVTLVRAGGVPFDLAELGLVQVMGEHLALAVRGDRSQRRRSEAAEALRASLLPHRPSGTR